MSGKAKCPNCGRQLPVSVLKCEECQVNMKITWETDITLLSNPLFLRQLLFVAVGAGLTMARTFLSGLVLLALNPGYNFASTA